MEDLAVTAMTKVLAEVLDEDTAATAAQALIGSAQDVRYDTTAGSLTVVFVRDALVR